MLHRYNFRQVQAHLDRNGLRYRIHSSDPVFIMQMGGKNGSFTCFVVCDDAQDRFAAFSRAPIRVPVSKRVAAGEYLNRANWNLAIGNFELDYADGEVRFRTAMDTDEIELNDRLIALTLGVNWRTMDRFLPGLLAVVFGDESPEVAVEIAEDGLRGPSPSDIEAAMRHLIDGAAGENPPGAPPAPLVDAVPAPVAEGVRRWIRRGRG